MEPKNLGALALIVFGGYFLVRNLNILPRPDIIWPLILVGLGIIALNQANSRPRRRSTNDEEVIWETNGSSTFMRTLVALPALIVAFVIGMIALGFLAPFFIIFLIFIPVILFFKIGWAFVRLLIPIAIAAAPLLLLFWILALIF